MQHVWEVKEQKADGSKAGVGDMSPETSSRTALFILTVLVLRSLWKAWQDPDLGEHPCGWYARAEEKRMGRSSRPWSQPQLQTGREMVVDRLWVMF